MLANSPANLQDLPSDLTREIAKFIPIHIQSLNAVSSTLNQKIKLEIKDLVNSELVRQEMLSFLRLGNYPFFIRRLEAGYGTEYFVTWINTIINKANESKELNVECLKKMLMSAKKHGMLDKKFYSFPDTIRGQCSGRYLTSQLFQFLARWITLDDQLTIVDQLLYFIMSLDERYKSLVHHDAITDGGQSYSETFENIWNKKVLPCVTILKYDFEERKSDFAVLCLLADARSRSVRFHRELVANKYSLIETSVWSKFIEDHTDEDIRKKMQEEVLMTKTVLRSIKNVLSRFDYDRINRIINGP